MNLIELDRIENLQNQKQKNFPVSWNVYLISYHCGSLNSVPV